MATTAKTVNGKEFFEVYVNGSDLCGRRIQRRKRSVESLRQAQDIEFEFERELAKLREEGTPYTWEEWFEIAITRMKNERANSTIINYQSYLEKWVAPHWNKRELKSITRDDVYTVVYETFDQKNSANSRRTLLKQTKRIFQVAMEDGLLDRNPAIGITVVVPEVEQDVLTNEEVKIFLQAVRDTNHRFSPIWVAALGTGMRSGELFARKVSLSKSSTKILARRITLRKDIFSAA